MTDGAISELIARLEAYAQESIAATAASSASASLAEDPSWPQDAAKRQEAIAQLAEELMALQSIYTDEALHLLRIAPPSLPSEAGPSSRGTSPSFQAADPQDWHPGSRITLALSTEIEPQNASVTSPEPIPIRIAITLPAFYPHSSKPPQMQLLSRYVGGFGVDHSLFGEILRAFYRQKDEDLRQDAASALDAGANDWIGGSMSQGVNWTSGEAILFEGIEWVKEKVSDWWIEKEQARLRNANDRGLDARQPAEAAVATAAADRGGSGRAVTTYETPASTHKPFKGDIITAEAITDRKSVFIGYAARIQHPDEVAEVLSHILSDRRVARATHPTINAWVCQTPDGVIHRDCDDDGESAAGGRLAHLLSLLELTNVIVVVSRWFGGIHLGPDRFKLINRAARDALELAGMVSGPLNPSSNATTGKADTRASKGVGKRS
ncbi:hypothetical protein ACQY0O_000901 [Thecaphora frezii]